MEKENGGESCVCQTDKRACPRRVTPCVRDTSESGPSIVRYVCRVTRCDPGHVSLTPGSDDKLRLSRLETGMDALCSRGNR